MKVKLSIVIPAYNEAINFKRGVLDEVSNFLKRQKYTWEVLLVNDGSTDKTLELLTGFAKSHPRFQVLNVPHTGKVGAVTAGVMQAQGEYILFTDFDQATPISQVEKVTKAFEEGAEVVIGQRSNLSKNRRLIPYLRGKAFNFLTQLIILPGITDTQCGFKAFKAEVGKRLFSLLKVTQHTQKGGYMGAFDVELLYLARKQHLKIAAVPVEWREIESGRLSNSEPIKMLRDIIKVRMYNLPPHFLPIVLVLLLSIPAFWQNVRPGYFSMHDDLQATRQLIMDKCFRDYQLPCRWSQDLGFGYGYPLFNFYPPLPYYFGEFFRIFGVQFIDIVKIIVIANIVMTALAMYLLAQEFWGRWGAVLSAVFYVYAPYHAVDIYVRGAINEAWAQIFFPLIFWSLYKVIKTNRSRYTLFTALSLAGLMLSHNPMLMIFAPSALIWSLYWLLITSNFKALPKLIVSGIWGLGLAAFFTLPVLFEQKYAHVDSLTSGYFNYLAHFVDLNQLFINRFWGYGASVLGPNDGMSFQIGFLHWIGALLSLVVALVIFSRRKAMAGAIIVVFFLTAIDTFMTHQKSTFIWMHLTSLEFLQFPWRFLSLTIFGTSFLGGSIVYLFWMKQFRFYQIILFSILLAVMVWFYKDYFTWDKYYPNMTDSEKFSGRSWQNQITSGIFDYLPIYAKLPPPHQAFGDAQITQGQGSFQEVFKNSVLQRYQLHLDNQGVFKINTLFFPGWRYFINGQEVMINPYEDQDAAVAVFHLAGGDYQVIAKFTNTWVRTMGNSISMIAWLVAVIALVVVFKTKKGRLNES